MLLHGNHGPTHNTPAKIGFIGTENRRRSTAYQALQHPSGNIAAAGLVYKEGGKKDGGIARETATFMLQFFQVQAAQIHNLPASFCQFQRLAKHGGMHQVCFECAGGKGYLLGMGKKRQGSAHIFVDEILCDEHATGAPPQSGVGNSLLNDFGHQAHDCGDAC